jgi:hypothetical protein
MDDACQTNEAKNFLYKRQNTTEKVRLPLKKYLPLELKKIATEISNITGKWNPVEILTPDAGNCKEEKAKFFESFMHNTPYNPQFEYLYALSIDAMTAKRKLINVFDRLCTYHARNKTEDITVKALRKKLRDDFATCELLLGIQTHDQHRIATAIDFKYEDISPDLYYTSLYDYHYKTKKQIRHEEKGLLTDEEKKFLKSITCGPEEIKKAFEWALTQYGLLRTPENKNGYVVIIDDKATSIDVRDKSVKGPTIFIPRTRKAKADKLMELMTHEIEGHARQSMNGQDLFIFGGGVLKIDDEMLYEGLAKRYDERFRRKFFGYKKFTPHPYFTFAIQKVQKGVSFYNIFAEQLDMRLHVKLKEEPDRTLPDMKEIDSKLLTKCMENSWSTTLRVIRGHTNTRNPKGFTMTKDIAYLKGWLVDKDLCRAELGFINEAGVFDTTMLQLIADCDLEEHMLPYPFKDVTMKYWENILKPQMKNNQKPDDVHHNDNHLILEGI